MLQTYYFEWYFVISQCSKRSLSDREQKFDEAESGLCFVEYLPSLKFTLGQNKEQLLL